MHDLAKSVLLIGMLAASAYAGSGWPGPRRTSRDCNKYLIIEVDHILSLAPRGDPGNFLLVYELGSKCNFCDPYSAVGWDVTLTAYAPSWLSDMAIALDDRPFLRPDSISQGPGGPQRYFSDRNNDGTRDLLNLLDYGIPAVEFGADGLLRVEFYDDYDDVPGGPDGLWESGTIVLSTQILTPWPCAGDANLDCRVDFSDVTEVLERWGITAPDFWGPGDASGSRTVNMDDIVAVLSNWGESCGPTLVSVQRVAADRP